jgi:hypothetical protein
MMRGRRSNGLGRRDNELEYRDLKMRGENNRVQFEMVVVYAGTSAVRNSGYAKVRHSAIFDEAQHKKMN